MTVELDELVILLSVPTEAEASLVVTALAAHDVRALITGDFTCGFRAHAPGMVNVLVKRADLGRARDVCEEVRQQDGDAEWSSIDVTNESEVEEESTEDVAVAARPDSGRMFWLIEGTFAAMLIIFAVIVGRVDLLIIYGVPSFVVGALLYFLTRAQLS